MITRIALAAALSAASVPAIAQTDACAPMPDIEDILRQEGGLEMMLITLDKAGESIAFFTNTDTRGWVMVRAINGWGCLEDGGPWWMTSAELRDAGSSVSH